MVVIAVSKYLFTFVKLRRANLQKMLSNIIIYFDKRIKLYTINVKISELINDGRAYVCPCTDHEDIVCVEFFELSNGSLEPKLLKNKEPVQNF